MMHLDALFHRHRPGLGRLSLRPLQLERDIETIHAWVTHTHAEYWQMQGHSLQQVTASYAVLCSSDHSRVFLGAHDEEPAFLVEAYLPEQHPIGKVYPVLPGDRGMHLLVAPPRVRVHGFTWQVFRTVMDFFFEDPAVSRVVVEPDVRNQKIHVLNQRAGFEYIDQVELPTKTAWLAVCTREQYAKALAREGCWV